MEYAAGRRQPYTSPIRLYVAASAVVLAAMSFLGVTDLDALLANSTEENIEALEEALGTDLRDPAFQAAFQPAAGHDLPDRQPCSARRS